jgi:hypothetical protein
MHHRQQTGKQLQHSGARGHDDKGGQAEEKDGKYQFDADFAGSFFRFLATADPQKVRLCA